MFKKLVLGLAASALFVGANGCSNSVSDEDSEIAVTSQALEFEATTPRDTADPNGPPQGSPEGWACTPDDYFAALWDCRARNPGMTCRVYYCASYFGFIFYRARVEPKTPETPYYSELPPQLPPGPGGGSSAPEWPSNGNGGTGSGGAPSYPGGGSSWPGDQKNWVFNCDQSNCQGYPCSSPYSGMIYGTDSDCQQALAIYCNGGGGQCTAVY